MSDNTFFTQFIISGGPIVWLVLLPLSVVTFYLVFDVCFSIRSSRLLDLGLAGRIMPHASMPPRQIAAQLSQARDLVGKAIAYTLNHARSLAADSSDLQHLAAESLTRQFTHLKRKIEWLSIIGSVAPMVGLFGTVFGMIRAFKILGVSAGTPQPDKLAGAISVALITTFWGLLVAIPALAVHGIYSTKLENILAQASVETEMILRKIASKYDKSAGARGGESSKVESKSF